MNVPPGIPSSVFLHYQYPRQDPLPPHIQNPRSAHPSVQQPQPSSSSFPQTSPHPPTPYARPSSSSSPYPHPPTPYARHAQPSSSSFPQTRPDPAHKTPQSHPQAQDAPREPPPNNAQLVPYQANACVPRSHPAAPLLSPLLSALDAHASGLRCALDERDTRIAALREQLARIQHKARADTALNTKCAALEYQRTMLEKKYTASVVAYTALQSRYATLERDCGAHSATLRNSNGNLWSKYEVLEKEHAALGAKHSALETEHAGIKNKYSALETKYAALDNEHSPLQARLDALESKHAELQATHARERDDLIARLAGLEQEHVGCVEREHALAEQIRDQKKLERLAAPAPASPVGGTWAALVSVQTENARLRALLAGPPAPRAPTKAARTEGEEDQDELEDDEVRCVLPHWCDRELIIAGGWPTGREGRSFGGGRQCR